MQIILTSNDLAPGSMRLCDLKRNVAATVFAVEDSGPLDPIAARLRDLGFVNGEPVRIVAAGPIGAEPLLVQIGFTRFALRRAEAARVLVHISSPERVPA